jgi:hypothetical protein
MNWKARRLKKNISLLFRLIIKYAPLAFKADAAHGNA